MTSRKATEIDILIGNQIFFIRKLHKTTRKELAEKLNLSSTQLQNYENGSNRISVSKLHTIARALDISIIKLIPDELK